MYEHKRNEVLELLGASDDVGLSVDYWTSFATENYLGVTVHLINSLGTKDDEELLSLVCVISVFSRRMLLKKDILHSLIK